jgi:membrane protease subunit HflC
MKTTSISWLAVVGIFAALVASGSVYTVREGEQAVITQFGLRRGAPVTDAGIHFKLPMIQQINRFEKRVVEWDGKPVRLTTRDKTYIWVDSFARWRIKDLDLYFVRVQNERSALSRLDDVLSSHTSGNVARHDLIEIIRTDPDRVPNPDSQIAATEENQATQKLHKIGYGRTRIEQDIIKGAAPILLKEYGIELLDYQVKRVEYDRDNLRKIHDRMTSERRQIAERFRSEGAAMAARIRGDQEREMQRIESEAYRKVQEIRGQADALASEIYAKAYNQPAEAVEFYGFQKAMETYETALPAGSMVLLSTESDLWRYLKSAQVMKAPQKAPETRAEPSNP